MKIKSMIQNTTTTNDKSLGMKMTLNQCDWMSKWGIVFQKVNAIGVWPKEIGIVFFFSNFRFLQTKITVLEMGVDSLFHVGWATANSNDDRMMFQEQVMYYLRPFVLHLNSNWANFGPNE